jgi:hypothetical protein
VIANIRRPFPARGLTKFRDEKKPDRFQEARLARAIAALINRPDCNLKRQNMKPAAGQSGKEKLASGSQPYSMGNRRCIWQKIQRLLSCPLLVESRLM